MGSGVNASREGGSSDIGCGHSFRQSWDPEGSDRPRVPGPSTFPAQPPAQAGAGSHSAGRWEAGPAPPPAPAPAPSRPARPRPRGRPAATYPQVGRPGRRPWSSPKGAGGIPRGRQPRQGAAYRRNPERALCGRGRGRGAGRGAPGAGEGGGAGPGLGLPTRAVGPGRRPPAAGPQTQALQRARMGGLPGAGEGRPHIPHPRSDGENRVAQGLPCPCRRTLCAQPRENGLLPSSRSPGNLGPESSPRPEVHLPATLPSPRRPPLSALT